MLKSFFYISLVLALASPTLAGVKEKKAIRALKAAAKAGLEEVKTACGNAKLANNIKVDAKFDAGQISIAESNLQDFVKGMKKVCEDVDYKEELAKLNKISFTLTDSDEKTGTKAKIYGAITTKGKGMRVALHIKSSMSNGRTTLIPSAIMELY